MTTENAFMEEPDWDDAFSDPAVRAVSRMVPKNDAEEHTRDDDARMLENIRRQAPWMKRSMRRVLEGMEAGQ